MHIGHSNSPSAEETQQAAWEASEGPQALRL